jgi:hypothetical protein
MSSISSASFQLSCSSAFGSRRFLIEVDRLTFCVQVYERCSHIRPVLRTHVIQTFTFRHRTGPGKLTLSRPAFQGGGDDDKKLSMTWSSAPKPYAANVYGQLVSSDEIRETRLTILQHPLVIPHKLIRHFDLIILFLFQCVPNIGP